MKKQVRRKRSVFPKVIAILMILTVIGLLIWLGYIVVQGINTVTKEADKIAALDMTQDTVETNVYTTGSFETVEYTMKKYMLQYSETLKEATGLLQDDTYTNMLLADNVAADGPAFTNSRAYIEEKRRLCEEKFQKIEDMTSEENILQALTDEGLGDSYIDNLYRKLYTHLMIDIIKPSCMYSLTSCNNVQAEMVEQLDDKLLILDFLTENQTQWKLEDGKLIFENAELTKQYTELANSTTDGELQGQG